MHTNKTKMLLLCIVALLSGILWRVEIEYHGWHGLIWISYFHFAVPIAALLFLLWLNAVAVIDVRRRTIANLIAIGWGVLAYLAVFISLSLMFAQGPSVFALARLSPPVLTLLSLSFYLVLPFIPISVFFLSRLIGVRIATRSLVTTLIALPVSVSLSIAILVLVQHKGSHDFIHAIKSGFLIPFWVLSFGSLFLNLSYDPIHRFPNRTDSA